MTSIAVVFMLKLHPNMAQKSGFVDKLPTFEVQRDLFLLQT